MADVKMPDFTKINPKPAAANQMETKTGSATAPRSSSAVQMLPGGMPDFTKVDPEKLSVQPKISTLSRVGNTVSGAAKSTASGLVNAGGTLLDIIRAADMRASQQNQNALQAAKNAEHYREMVQRGYMDDGTKLDEAGKKRLLMLADRAEKSVTANNQLNETLHEPIKQATQATQAKADDLAQSSEANISKAKKGLGAVGQTVVDVGVAGTQMLGDAVANALVPGAGLAAMGARAFGSAAQEARLNGGTLGQQVGYGAAVAGVEMLTEKMFDGLAGIYGGGGADDVVKKAIDKLAKSKAGKDALTILSGMGGEALEEVVSGVIDPALKSIYDGEKIGSHYNAETASDILHSAIVGGVLGGIGSGTTVLKGQNAPLDSKGNVNTKAEGNVTAKAENAAQTVTEPNAGVQTKTQTDPLAQAMFGESTQQNVENGESDADIRARISKDLADFTSSDADAIADGNPDVEEDLPQSIGAAQSGFETPDSQSVERTSNLASGVAEYNRYEGEATARSRADYDELFKYQSQTEAQSMQQADNLLYVQQDGQRRFLMDVDPEAYDDTVSYLESAPAWNGVMTDAAMLIKTELQGRSVNGEVSEDTYVAWLKTMQEHATETGRGTQAWAKWTRRDNDAGQATELDAWDRLEKNDSLNDEQRRQIFQSVIKFDQRIESARTDADLKSVILEIASQRGTTNGLTGKQSRILRFLAEKSLNGMDFEQLKQFAYQSASAMTTDGMDGDIGRKIKAIQVLNMLSNPKTAAKNIAGNTSFYGLDAMTMRGASIIDMALSKVTGTRSVAMESSLLTDSKARSDIAKAIQLSMAEATMDVDMGGGNRYQNGSSRTFKASGNIVDRILSACERNMAYALNTTDEAYKGAARATEHNTQKLIDEGKIKTNNADYAAEQAQSLAEYRTFQGHGKIATAIQTVHDVLNLIGIGDSGQTLGPQGLTVHSFGVGDLVAPFTRVAGNLAGVGVDYSPINAVKGTVEVIDCIRKGVTNLDVDPAAQSKAVSDMARGLTGSALAYGVAVIAKAGIIRRADDEGDKDVASLNQSEGMRGTQINIDAAKRWIDGGDGSWKNGDTLVDLSNLEPINFIVSLGVELSDNEDTDGIVSKFTDVSMYKDTAKSAVETAADLPILQTVGDYAKDVMVYHKDPIRAAAEALGKSAISSVTPNAIAMFAKGKDDKQRSTSSEDELTSVLRDTFKSRIPGLRETLPTTVNTLGEEKPNPGTTAERIFNAMLNPIGVNEYSQSAVSQEMTRVRDKTGIVDFYPTTRKPSEVKYTDKNGNEHKVELSYEQKQKYQATASAAQMTTTAELIGSSAYKSANADMQAKLLKRCLDYSNQYAKAQILGKDSVDAWVRNSQTAQKDIGISQSEFFYYYEKYGSDLMGGGAYEKLKAAVSAGLTVDQYAHLKANDNVDGKGKVSQDDAQKYLDSTSYSRETKAALWNIIDSSWKNNPYG